VPEAPQEDFVRSVVVIGLGYVGLPLALEAVRAGHEVTGLEVDVAKVEAINAGRSPVDDIHDDDLAIALKDGFTATTQTSALATADIAVICVPTPLDRHQQPDLTAVFSATEAIAVHLRPGMLVVLESTTYPGTTDGAVRRRLEAGGLVAGRDFHLAFSPERIDPGNPHFSVRNTPKVVGGVNPTSTAAACAFYASVVTEVVPVKGTREAEMAKLLENTYRQVNIALVNELAVFCRELGVDIWEAIRAASSKPFGFQAFRPGAGVGGHCIPIDPGYLSHSIRELGYQFRFVELAQEISNRMPAYVVRRAQDALNARGIAMSRSRVLVLGLSYKADISDERETPARPVIRGLRALGAEVSAADPHVPQFIVDDVAVPVIPHEGDLTGFDLVLLLQPHTAFGLDTLTERVGHVFDCTGRIDGPAVDRL